MPGQAGPDLVSLAQQGNAGRCLGHNGLHGQGLTWQPAAWFWAPAPHRCCGWHLMLSHRFRCLLSCCRPLMPPSHLHLRLQQGGLSSCARPGMQPMLHSRRRFCGWCLSQRGVQALWQRCCVRASPESAGLACGDPSSSASPPFCTLVCPFAWLGRCWAPAFLLLLLLPLPLQDPSLQQSHTTSARP